MDNTDWVLFHEPLENIQDPGLKEALIRLRRIMDMLDKNIYHQEYDFTDVGELLKKQDYWENRARALIKQQQLDV